MLSQWFFYTTIISGVMLYMKYLIIDTLSEGDSEEEIRYLPRYDKTWNMALIYKNKGENELLNQWMKRVTLNFHSKSLGAYEIGNKEAWINGISNI